VEPEHLADPRRFDFAGLDGRRLAKRDPVPVMSEAEELALEASLA